jgi:hypothetical protein
LIPEIFENLNRRSLIPRESAEDFVAAVDLIANWRQETFQGTRYENELGVVWMACCDLPGAPPRSKTQQYRLELGDVARYFRGIAHNTELQADLLRRLRPPAATVRASDNLHDVRVLLNVDEMGLGSTTQTDPEAQAPASTVLL